MKVKEMKVRKIITFILVCTLLVSVGVGNNYITTQAYTSVPSIVKPCPSCHRSVTSYGYDHHFTGGTTSAIAGDYCIGCEQIVPSGERHMTVWYKDKYFFSCRCGHSFTAYSDEPEIGEHIVKTE